MFSSTPSHSELPSSMGTSKGYLYICVDLFNITNMGSVIILNCIVNLSAAVYKWKCIIFLEFIGLTRNVIFKKFDNKSHCLI